MVERTDYEKWSSVPNLQGNGSPITTANYTDDDTTHQDGRMRLYSSNIA